MAPPASLHAMALRSVSRNMKMIFDIGDIPYEHIRAALMNVTNADQLRRLEEASPQIIGHDAEVWHKLLARDAPHYDKAVEPKNAANWWKVHRKFVRDEKLRVERHREQLRAKLKDKKDQREESTVTIDTNKKMPVKRRWGAQAPSAPAKTGGAKLLHSIKKGGNSGVVTKRFNQPVNPAIAARASAKGGGLPPSTDAKDKAGVVTQSSKDQVKSRPASGTVPSESKGRVGRPAGRR